MSPVQQCSVQVSDFAVQLLQSCIAVLLQGWGEGGVEGEFTLMSLVTYVFFPKIGFEEVPA